jgi:hypothetical protein
MVTTPTDPEEPVREMKRLSAAEAMAKAAENPDSLKTA